MSSRYVFLGLLLMIFLSGCRYRKGSAFTYSESGDSITYLILDAGSGRHISKKINSLRQLHSLKKDDCQIIFVSDSLSISHRQSVLLFNSVLPDMEDDMLSKGLMGAFGTKQVITYLVVTKDNFNAFFIESGKNP